MPLYDLPIVFGDNWQGVQILFPKRANRRVDTPPDELVLAVAQELCSEIQHSLLLPAGRRQAVPNLSPSCSSPSSEHSNTRPMEFQEPPVKHQSGKRTSVVGKFDTPLQFRPSLLQPKQFICLLRNPKCCFAQSDSNSNRYNPDPHPPS